MQRSGFSEGFMEDTAEQFRKEVRLYVVVGLGNPGREYSRSRHNVGARVVALMGRKVAHTPYIRKPYAMWKKFLLDTKAVYLVRPRTYMNLNGQAVRQFLDQEKISNYNLLVIHDDLDLPLGRLRFKRKGSSGGHRGVSSVIEALGTEEFNRLKVGIGRPGERGADVVKFVLGNPTAEEAGVFREAERKAAKAAWLWVEHGIDYCMDRFNRAAD